MIVSKDLEKPLLESTLTPKLRKLFDDEVQRQANFIQNALAAGADEEALNAFGITKRRHGTEIISELLKSAEVEYPDHVAFLRLAGPDISKAVAARIGRPFAESISDLIGAARRLADKTYGRHGLPTGFTRYGLPAGADKTDWSSWNNIASRPIENWQLLADASELAKLAAASKLAKLAGTSEFAKLADAIKDHPISHAGQLHAAARRLEAVSLEDPVDKFMLVVASMELQRSIDTLIAVTARRMASGLTHADALFRGEANKTVTRKGGMAASEAKKEESRTNRDRVLAIAQPIREAEPMLFDTELIERIEDKMSKDFPKRQLIKRKTIEGHLRALKRSGDLLPKAKTPSS